MTIEEIMAECLGNEELVANYDRLYGANMGQIVRASPIEKMIDESTGRTTEEMYKFFGFVFDVVISRFPATQQDATQ